MEIAPTYIKGQTHPLRGLRPERSDGNMGVELSHIKSQAQIQRAEAVQRIQQSDFNGEPEVNFLRAVSRPSDFILDANGNIDFPAEIAKFNESLGTPPTMEKLREARDQLRLEETPSSQEQRLNHEKKLIVGQYLSIVAAQQRIERDQHLIETANSGELNSSFLSGGRTAAEWVESWGQSINRDLQYIAYYQRELDAILQKYGVEN